MQSKDNNMPVNMRVNIRGGLLLQLLCRIFFLTFTNLKLFPFVETPHLNKKNYFELRQSKSPTLKKTGNTF